MDLLKVLRAIQEDLSTEKAKPRAHRDHALIAALRIARFRARQVGDTFAWLLLGLDKQYILAMGRNARVPVPDAGHGATGVEVIAQGLAAKGWGFPVLRDLTHCLRIGDITFVKPERVPRLAPVEVKTKYLGQMVGEGGETKNEYEVRVMSPMEFDPEGTVVSTPTDRGVTLLDLPTDKSTRAKRQEARMANAVLDSLAPTGQVVPDGQGGRVFMEIVGSAKDRWSVLRRLIRTAHADGFAGESIDEGAFYYAVFYQKGGLDVESVSDVRLAEGVKQSGLLLPPPANNSMVLNFLPHSDEDRHERDYMPFYLWPITKRAIFEMHRGELMIVVAHNPAQFVERLTAAGLEVEHKPGSPTWDSIVVSTRVTTPDGSVWHGEYKFVSTHITAAINEFRSAQFVVDAVTGITQTFTTEIGPTLASQWAHDRAVRALQDDASPADIE